MICEEVFPLLDSFALFFRIKDELCIPEIPEMVFGNTCLQIMHENNFSISINAVDALSKVDTKHDLMKVHAAEEWQKYRYYIFVY